MGRNTPVIRDRCKTSPSAQCGRQTQILVLEIFNVFLRLKSSCFLILNRIERSAKVSVITTLLFPLCLYGCVTRPKAFPSGPGPEVTRILDSLKEQKNDLKSFKGVGRFKTVRGTSITTRMVWIGSQPQKLRVETLGPWGQPTLTLVINGSSFFLHTHHDNRYFKGDATAGNLSRFVSVPVRAEDLVGLLSGQPPILPFHHAKIRASTAEGGGWLLSLHKKWGRLIEKIWLKDDEKGVEQVEVFDGWGNLQYKVAFSDFDQMESLCLPHRIAISDTQGLLWSLTVEKFWTKVSIPEGAYTLEVSSAEEMDLDS